MRLPLRQARHGVLLLDKPIGLSSNQALLRVKGLLHATKAGHTGTLDPLASGLLPLCFGEGTKFSQELFAASKTYEATITLGIRTTTGDAEGAPIDRRPVCCDQLAIIAALPYFRGDILQIPPMYSALKRAGKPLYEYARAGEVLERAPRPVTIHTLELLDCTLPTLPQFTIKVVCSKGVYIRTLAEDLGEFLKCGAHLSALRRTAVGCTTLAQAVPLQALIDADDASAYLQPVETLLSEIPAVHLTAILSQRFQQGQRLRLSENTAENILPEEQSSRVVSVWGPEQRLLGTAQFFQGLLMPERLLRI